MSEPTTPPPPTPDPSASAREWAARDNVERLYVASVLRRERDAATKSDNPEAALPCAIARRVLADAPALLARLEEAERTVREIHGLLIDAMSQHNKGIDDDWDLVARAHSEADAFLAPPTGASDTMRAIMRRHEALEQASNGDSTLILEIDPGPSDDTAWRADFPRRCALCGVYEPLVTLVRQGDGGSCTAHGGEAEAAICVDSWGCIRRRLHGVGAASCGAAQDRVGRGEVGL